MAVIALGAAAAYAWDLDVQGWSNPYYTAVVQAGQQSWSSFLLGSLEVGNAVASDKPPLAFWVMALSARAFGLSSWSVLLPQVAETIATVLVLHRMGRELAGRAAGVVAALVYATSPVVLVMARYNHPDTLMTLLLVVAAWCCLRATRSTAWGWVTACGALLGLGFLTKWGVALIPGPAFAVALWVSTHGSLRQRLQRVANFAGSGFVSIASWVVPVLLVPSARRPYADGSQGSILSLMLGRDGFSRLGGTRGAGTQEVAGTPGPWRLLTPPFATQVGWHLPLAVGVLALVALLAARDRRSHAVSPSGAVVERAGWLLVVGWLVTGLVVLSVMSGPMHPYYSVMLVPAVALSIGAGLASLRRRNRLPLALLPAAATLAYQVLVFRRSGVPDQTALDDCLAVVATGMDAVAVAGRRWAQRALPCLLLAPLLVLPLAFGLTTDSHKVSGYDPVAGPLTPTPRSAYPDALVRYLESHRSNTLWVAATPRATAASVLQLQSSSPVLPLGGFTGHAAGPTLDQVRGWTESDRLRFLVLPQEYTTHLFDTPAALAGYPVASILQWAQQTGCVQRQAFGSYVVVDLDADSIPRHPGCG
ncbi:ArnT family glycosyltransferase [Pedococcus sp. NPDC057267]|uniref:ArnT family glycosyltransferase n=1 Tax=Pedococcus sp. NPDC057267 TaxID=3346077 RepID=UPI003627B4A7